MTDNYENYEELESPYNSFSDVYTDRKNDWSNLSIGGNKGLLLHEEYDSRQYWLPMDSYIFYLDNYQIFPFYQTLSYHKKSLNNINVLKERLISWSYPSLDFNSDQYSLPFTEMLYVDRKLTSAYNFHNKPLWEVKCQEQSWPQAGGISIPEKYYAVSVLKYFNRDEDAIEKCKEICRYHFTILSDYIVFSRQSDYALFKLFMHE